MKQLCFLEVDLCYQKDCLTNMLKTVSPIKREKLKKYRYDIDRKIGIYADILLRNLIFHAYGLSCKDIVFEVGETGKPYLACAPHLEFNVAHTRNAVAIALSDGPVGVDVERIRPTDMRLVQDIFTESELLWLNSEGTGRYRRFFDIWTKKEAVVKFDGTGLPDDLRAVDVTGCLAPKILSTLHFGDYVVSVCAEAEFSKTDIIRITEPELIDKWRQNCAPDSDFFDGE